MFRKFKSLASARLGGAVREARAEDARQPDEPSSAELYLRTLKQYAVLLEYKRLQQSAPAGVYLLPSPHSFSTFHGLIFVRKGHYRGAILSFNVTLPAGYPVQPPMLAFTPSAPELFHPLVAANGAVDTEQLQWQPQHHSLSHALHFVKKLFYKVDWWADGEAGRPEARELWRANKDEFHRRVAACVAWSVDAVQHNGRAMHVSPHSQQHDALWTRLLEQQQQRQGQGQGQEAGSSSSSEQAQPSYLSWFLPGPASVVGRDDVLLAGSAAGRPAVAKRVAVSAAEERELLDEERRRRAEERRRRVEAAAGQDEGERQETQAEAEAEAEVHTAAYALDESVTPEEEELP